MKCFFPVGNCHFGSPQNKFPSFSKVKSKKKKKTKTKTKTKKKSSPLFITFPPFLLQFSFFSSQFSPLPLFSRYVSKNFPDRSLWGARPLPVTPLVGTWLRQGAYSASQIYQWPLFYLKIGLEIGHVFAKCLIFDEFFLWFIYRLSKSTCIPIYIVKSADWF